MGTETFQLEQDYLEDIKPIILIDPGTVLNGTIEVAEIVQPKSEIGWQLALKMVVTDENEWFDKVLYDYTTLVGKQVHANKAAWYAISNNKDENLAVASAKATLAKHLGTTVKKLEEDYLSQAEDLRGTLQKLFYQFYLTQAKSDIPIPSSYINVGDEQNKIYNSLQIDRNDPIGSLKALTGKAVEIFIGNHNEYPKGKFNQTIVGVKLTG